MDASLCRPVFGMDEGQCMLGHSAHLCPDSPPTNTPKWQSVLSFCHLMHVKQHLVLFEQSHGTSLLVTCNQIPNFIYYFRKKGDEININIWMLNTYIYDRVLNILSRLLMITFLPGYNRSMITYVLSLSKLQ